MYSTEMDADEIWKDSKLAYAIESCIWRVTVEMHAQDLLTFQQKGNILDTTDSSSVKAARLLLWIRNSTKCHEQIDHHHQYLYNVCSVFLKQEHPPLTQLTKDILSHLKACNVESGSQMLSNETESKDPEGVLRKASSNLAKNITTCLLKLTDDLFAEQMLTFEHADYLRSSKECEYHKSSLLVHWLQNDLRSHKNQDQYLGELCKVLLRQRHGPLTKVVQSMIQELQLDISIDEPQQKENMSKQFKMILWPVIIFGLSIVALPGLKEPFFGLLKAVYTNKFHQRENVLVPRRLVGIGANMTVTVITLDGHAKESSDSERSVVRAILSCNTEESPVFDRHDGTYLISIIPEQLGIHWLSVAINGESVRGSPFKIKVVPQRDYTKLKNPVDEITNINKPKYIAFSDDGKMFVTSGRDHCIYVYDKNGENYTIGSKGNGSLQFYDPCGIDIRGDTVYVSEFKGHRIHILSTKGEFIGTFGREGKNLERFNHPHDVKIGCNNNVYVADTSNNRILEFSLPDWRFMNSLDEFSCPRIIAFDLSCTPHILAGKKTGIPTGSQEKLDETNEGLLGMVIDPSGYSLSTRSDENRLLISDPSGRVVNDAKGLNNPHGVSISPDGSVWVADTNNNRLVKY